MPNYFTKGYHRRTKRQGRRFWRWLEFLCLAVSVACIILLISNHVRKQQRAAEELNATRVFDDAQMTVAQGTPAPASSNSPQMLAEAERLLRENPDLVGMVGYGDSSLYVCQTTDNSYYASHRFDGSEDPAGMIYMDCRCSAWPLGDNTILYGHNMRDGSRFGKLNRLTKQDYLEEHPIVRYASLYEINDYVPIAVFYASVDEQSDAYFNFAQPSFPDEQSFNAYVQSVQARSVIRSSTPVKYGDNLLTLATCAGDAEGERLVVVCAPAPTEASPE